MTIGIRTIPRIILIPEITMMTKNKDKQNLDKNLVSDTKMIRTPPATQEQRDPTTILDPRIDCLCRFRRWRNRNPIPHTRHEPRNEILNPLP